MQCGYWDAGLCRSCTWLETPYADQVAAKQRAAAAALGEWAVEWLPPVTGPEEGFRTKAKMVVAGTVEAPTLGILAADGRGTDLRACGLHDPRLQAALPVLAALVTRAALTPYSVPERSGELKHVIVTVAPDGGLMVRLVLRSTESVARIEKHLPWLRAELPDLRVLSVNLQPAHAAVLEGEREDLLLGESLPIGLDGADGVTLHLGPRSFFQTNTGIAAALYREAVAWTSSLEVRTVWDLYCGVGGFALHLARPGRSVHGVEVSPQAVEAARTSAAEAGVAATFEAGDATAWIEGREVADLVVVNPPRRGLGADLTAALEAARPSYLLYSSCNPATLGRDLAAMPSLVPVRARVFDMFPQTGHQEVLVLCRADRGH
ncbi:methyltransferase domain-containing protein [Nocardioides marmoribigeumensis]|uniref:23S rRNA (Uracil747-C5)-methyltransferase n=1 Tax=Nocardioides marmoribigeumensis TaxID=433649 RepID=A0ABU2BUW2_9ACTN|nr:methyltransferase domain-containing protein [Nocardioides marmoribigeumensis]MDR7361814.1 23S rRNA (uracil747-C5)-methyltransferase [Nocardioides marmoribigeumensis]